MDKSYNKKILVVSYESGGAQILSSWVRRHSVNTDIFYCLDGPAVKIFKHKLGDISMVELEFIQELRPDIDQVLTGTSWMPNLERKAVKLAKLNKIFCTSVLDHWTNYTKRFLPNNLWESIPANWLEYLPDLVWVCDDYAYNIALKEGFPKEKLKIITNPYFMEIKQSLEQKTNRIIKNKLHMLYISEPIADDLLATYGDSNFWGYNEFDLINSLLESLCKFNKKKQQIEVRLRLHPNEKNIKYDRLVGGNKNLHISHESDLIDDILWSDVVVGGESMALVIALLAKKQVFSCIPKTAKKKCCLPHKEIFRGNSINEIFDIVSGFLPIYHSIKNKDV